MKIVEYSEKYKKYFIDMNIEWISAMFKVEQTDIDVFNNIDKSIKNGGQIYFAIDNDDSVLACCMIIRVSDEEWEIEKFCAKGMYTGTGAGTACLKACIDHARKNNAKKILIVSNTKCVHAINLYKKFGFKEIPVDMQRFPFERANIAFELNI